MIGYDDSDTAEPGDVAPSDFVGLLRTGLRVVSSHWYGSTDPNSSWDADRLGRFWLRTSSPGSAASPRLRLYQQLAASGPGLGWRDLKLRKVLFDDAPNTVTFSVASPAAADVAWTDLDLATLLEDVQDSGQAECKVSEAILRVRVKAGASETLGADNAYIAFRQKGSTVEQRVYAQVAARYAEATVVVPLDSSEVCQFHVVVGTGTPSFTYEAELIGCMETI